MIYRNGLASELEVMHKAAENCHIQIPLEVVRCILSFSAEGGEGVLEVILKFW